MKDFTKQWITKAEEDDKAAQMLLEYSFPAFAPICFHIQQAAEKYVKALIVEYDLPLSKTHNIVFLIQESLLDKFPEFEEIIEAARLLSSYGVEPRYPGNYPVLTKRNADEAMKALNQIKQAVFTKLNPE